MEKLFKISSVFALFAGFLVFLCAFEPIGLAEGAYVFAVPIFLVARFGKLSKKLWIVLTFVFSWLAWIFLLFWLRFVYPPTGFLFLFGLSLIISVFYFLWFLELRRVALLNFEHIGLRLIRVFYLAALWVFLEYLRSFIFTGFPWLLLAHSQWLRPAIIQSAEFGGPYIVSFVLIFFNLALAEFVSKLWMRHKWRVRHLDANNAVFKPSALSFELYLAISFILASFYLYVSSVPTLSAPKKVFRAGMVQTDFAGIMNWDANLGNSNMMVIKKLTLALEKARVAVVLWPESSTPPMWPVIGTEGVKEWIEEISTQMNAPILMGNAAYIKTEKSFDSYNASFVVSPKTGLSEKFYAKQKLVPFGEYLPAWCFFLKTSVVPVGRMTRGTGPVNLDAEIAGKNYSVGSVICYEDIFPWIGANAVKAGADLLFVCTNDSWYGREGGAWQHATHSAFLAVYTRRPVLRASINGLSGVFDQFGRLVPTFTLKNTEGGIYDSSSKPADVLDIVDDSGKALSPDTFKRKRSSPMLDDNGNIYFRGAAYADVHTYEKFDKYKTFYVRYGDWLPKLCFAYCVILILRRKKVFRSQ